MSFYKAGIDIGSTTIKFVVMDENNNICFKDYRRHLSNIQETLLGLVKAEQETVTADSAVKKLENS